jgi:hypothetical protein
MNSTTSSIDRVQFTASPALSIGLFDPQPKEMMFYLYLPIKMIDSVIMDYEPRLDVFGDMIHAAIADFGRERVYDQYIYVTAKRLFVTPDNIGNRPGWHCDGWGTDDINYIWADKHSTVFHDGQFDVALDDVQCLDDLNEQAGVFGEYTMPEKTLIRIDPFCPHRTPKITQSGFRTFVKISFSKHRYNLEGNSHNYHFNYDWSLHERGQIRNMENKDFHVEPM